MSIPTYKKLKRPILEYLASTQGSVKKAIIRKELAKKLGITAEELKESIPSGGCRFSNRANWAIHEIKKDGLVEVLERGYYKMTQNGRSELCNSGGGGTL